MPKYDERDQLLREYIAKYPDAQTLTLAKGFYKKHPAWFRSVESCRSAVRVIRGNHGAFSKKYIADKSLYRPPGKSGELPPCPPSHADEWKKYIFPKSKRLLILSDIHVPYQDQKAMNLIAKRCKDHYAPDAILLNGDIGDYYSVSHWERNPNKRKLKVEIDAIGEFLDWLRDVFPTQIIVYKEGNHDERIDNFIWQKAPELWDMPQCRLPEMLQLTKRKIEHVSDQRMIFFSGKNQKGSSGLLIFHGHELPRGLTNPVNMGRGAFLRTNHTMLCGHGHRSSHHPESNVLHEITSCWSTGCLCDMNPRFSRVNKWNLGYATVDSYGPGEWKVNNYIIDKNTYKVW